MTDNRQASFLQSSDTFYEIVRLFLGDCQAFFEDLKPILGKEKNISHDISSDLSEPIASLYFAYVALSGPGSMHF